jgi:hypothetical protein
MGFCSIKRDYPMRVQFGKGLAVHAAYASAAYKESPRIYIACCYKKISASDVISNTNKITCKSCMKQMGILDEKASPVRYIVKDNETGQYLKKGSYCIGWVDDPTNATLYKMKHVADDHTMLSLYESDDGRRLTYGELNDLSREERNSANFKRITIKNPKRDVKKVTLLIE